MVDSTSAPTQDIPDLLKTQYLDIVNAKILRIQDSIGQLILLLSRTQKKQKWVQDGLVALSCATTVGFFAFWGLDEKVMAILTGIFSAGNTLVSGFSASWKLNAKIDLMGGILSDFYRINWDYDYLSNRITGNDCTVKEILALIKDLNQQQQDIVRKVVENQKDLPPEGLSFLRPEVPSRSRALEPGETPDPILAELKKNW